MKLNYKAFTLIELLAVIVILAIIALIATPIVLNIIKDSRESAGLRSAEMYLDAVEQSISVEKMNNPNFNPNTCTITEEGNLLCDDKDLIDIKVKGSKPTNGKIIFEKGKIKNVTLEYGNDKVIIMNTKGELQYQNYISINNYQHKHTNGSIEDHNVTFDSNGHGTCTKCNEEVLAAGLYDENDNLVASWDTLVNDYGLDMEKDGISGAPLSAPSQPSFLTSKILQNNDLTIGSKIVIEESITKIGISQFNESNIKEVLIPNSVTSIGEYAFSRCTSLKTIEILDSVTSIGGRAFDGCSGLTSIEIPDSVTSIGGSAFYGCSGLTSIEIPDSVTSIDGGTFMSCTGLTFVTIPNSVTSIGNNAFYGCAGLTTLNLGKSVTSIGDYAFNGCTGLTFVTIPNSVTSIGNNAFYGCAGLTTLNLGKSITSIGDSAFGGCTGLTSVTIPNSVTSIGDSAFSRCTSLKTIEIPKSVTSIGDSAFANISATIIFQDGIEFIDGFKNYIGSSITIPKSVTNIGDNAFQNCTNLTSITIPESVISIGDSAFKNCTGLISITIPSSVTSIGDSAFGGCTGLTSVTIPNSVTSIGDSAFANISATIIFQDGIEFIDGFKNYIGSSITIPDSVTNIGQYAFQSSTNLTSIYIPSSVTTINAPYYVPAPFYGCSSTLKIYTGVKEDEIPSGWGTYWNYYSDTGTLDVTYGVTREEYESLIG